MNAVAPEVDNTALLLSDFDYELPEHLIAQVPPERRDGARLLVMDRATGTTHQSRIDSIGDWLAPGDLLVANNSRVIPARLRGQRVPNGDAEVLLLRKEGDLWSALARPAKRLRPGVRLAFPARRHGLPPAEATVEANLGAGEIRLRFENGFDRQLDAYGEPPLPPYIRSRLQDESRYQTVYASPPGSAAAPTAGLHFTHELIASLRERSIDWAEITLHVGLDTFRPVTAERIEEHKIHREWCQVSAETAGHIAACRRRGGRVVAVGTTAARTLETLGKDWSDEAPEGLAGFTDVFILPGHRWRLVDAMITNFHLPRSTLLMLVSAFAGRAAILAAYEESVAAGFRFYSFGDAMLIR